jgi:NAD-dependent deacetylase
MDEDELRSRAEQVARRLQGHKRLLFITGAGLSAESGLPTYRGVGGLYAGQTTEHGMPIEEALSGPTFQRQPEITWRHIARLEAAVRGATPNRAHQLIAALEREHEVVVLTQNVDGFHRAAGSTRVIDIHGDCHRLLCTRCSHHESCSSYEGLPMPPSCPRCAALLRPDVVLFEEMLPPYKLQMLAHELACGFDAYFSIGTSSLFPYICEPMFTAAQRRRLTIEINPEPTDVSEVVEYGFRCGAGRALSAIFER